MSVVITNETRKRLNHRQGALLAIAEAYLAAMRKRAAREARKQMRRNLQYRGEGQE